jgi:hypothetical protein
MDDQYEGHPDPQVPEPPDFPVFSEEAIRELRAWAEMFTQLADQYELMSEEKCVGKPGSKYKPKPCGPGIPGICKTLNEWACYWKQWGDAIHTKVIGPGPVDPPPDPPFV